MGIIHWLHRKPLCCQYQAYQTSASRFPKLWKVHLKIGSPMALWHGRPLFFFPMREVKRRIAQECVGDMEKLGGIYFCHKKFSHMAWEAIRDVPWFFWGDRKLTEFFFRYMNGSEVIMSAYNLLNISMCKCMLTRIRWRARYSSPSILLPFILRPPLIIRPPNLVLKCHPVF